MTKRLKIIASAIAAILIGAVIYPAGSDATANKSEISTPVELVAGFIKILRLTRDQHVDGLTHEETLEKGVNAFLRTLDPYSVYLTAEKYRAYKENIQTHYVGIGITGNTSSGSQAGIVIEEVLPGGPASLSGLRAGDVIIALDGAPVEGFDNDAIERIRGTEGSEVRLGILRNNKKFDVVVKRSSIRAPSVLSYLWKGNNKKVLFVSVSGFVQNTGKEFADALALHLPQTPDAIIIDMRDNSGGLVVEAIESASLFLTPGTTILTERYRDGDITLKAHVGDPALYVADSNGGKNHGVLRDYEHLLREQIPIWIMVNRRSASAAEIFVAALKDNRRAQIIGERTTGKAMIQNMIAIPATGGAIKLTVARYTTPNGDSIQDVGIAPNIEVTDSQTDKSTSKSSLRNRQHFLYHAHGPNNRFDSLTEKTLNLALGKRGRTRALP